MQFELATFKISITRLILLVSLLLTVFYNKAFFHNAAEVYTDGATDLLFLLSLALFLFSTTVLVLSFLCIRFLTKPLLIIVLLGSAGASYYMNSFNVVIDSTMITNIVQTDQQEASDLLSFQLILQVLLLGIIPAWLLWKSRVECESFTLEIFRRLKLISFAIVLMLVCIVPFSSHYASFFREHKILRYYANPATFIYSSFVFADAALGRSEITEKTALGLDAEIPAQDLSRELLILVVGEAARADHFSLNGYERNTNPRLSMELVTSLADVTSCGTATAYSVPCMFSQAGRTDFDLDSAYASENLLDVLTHADVNVLWRDNNSDSKGVAAHLNYEEFRDNSANPVCDEECRDVGMLSGLDDYITAHDEGDIVIVLHQMGMHGPAYYKRYPKEFERFTPTCQSSQLEKCSDEEINNAYDNAILYTDYFLSQVIAFLKPYNNQFETAMFYMSDHGESLGENGIYLHGLPWLFAPDNQKHVASILWFGSGYRVDRQWISSQVNTAFSHDNFFHTVLGLFEINTTSYNGDLDIIRKHASDECQQGVCRSLSLD